MEGLPIHMSPTSDISGLSKPEDSADRRMQLGNLAPQKEANFLAASQPFVIFKTLGNGRASIVGSCAQ